MATIIFAESTFSFTLHNIKSSASKLHKQNVNEKPIETSLLENIMAYR